MLTEQNLSLLLNHPARAPLQAPAPRLGRAAVPSGAVPDGVTTGVLPNYSARSRG